MSAVARPRLLLLAALAAAALVVIWLGRTPFRNWQSRRLVESARAFVKSGDLRAAHLSNQEALLKDPANVDACKIAAQIAEAGRSPLAIQWRQRVAEIQKGDAESLIQLAATATLFGDNFIAENALAQVPVSERNRSDFLQAAANLAIALKQYAAAEEQFQKMLAADPKNELLALNLATVRIALRRPAQLPEARATLQTLAAKPSLRAAALRALISDARVSGESARAMQLAGELHRDGQATLGDQLLWLEELQHAGSAELQAGLSKLLEGALDSPEIAYTLMTWMNAHGLAARSIQWSESLAPKVRRQLPVPLAEAEALTAIGDWKKLRELIRDADWGDLEFIRLAIQARLILEADGRKRRAEFRTAWDRATNSTQGNPISLTMLGRLVNGWGWDDEAAQAWWLAAKHSNGGRTALKALFEKYSVAKNTRELYRVAQRVLETEPANPVAKNNVASLALLLGEDEPTAHLLAEEIHRLSPAQPVITATYALSLHRQKRTADAVAVLKKIPAQAFEDPSLAACYGFLLAENGEHEAARPFLEKARGNGRQLFPEEAAMVADALRRIR